MIFIVIYHLRARAGRVGGGCGNLAGRALSESLMTFRLLKFPEIPTVSPDDDSEDRELDRDDLFILPCFTYGPGRVGGGRGDLAGRALSLMAFGPLKFPEIIDPHFPFPGNWPPIGDPAEHEYGDQRVRRHCGRGLQPAACADPAGRVAGAASACCPASGPAADVARGGWAPPPLPRPLHRAKEKRIRREREELR